MKKQIATVWSGKLIKAIVVLTFMLAISGTTLAQTTYKVGDKVELMVMGQWGPATIEKVLGDGRYMLTDETSGISGMSQSDKFIRPRQVPGSTTKNQTRSSTTLSTENTIGERYGTREPRTCVDTKAPLRGAITPALAAKYFTCQYEKEATGLLYLVDNVKFEVGGGIPYRAMMSVSLPQIDVNYPVYPIRGMYTLYLYQRIYEKNDKPRFTVQNVKREGFCYRTTFGDWRCL